MTFLKASWASIFLVAGLASTGVSATRTWDGGGNTTLFTTAANWDGDATVPANGDILNFGASSGTTNLVLFNNGGTFDAPSVAFLGTAPAYDLRSATVFDSLNLTATGTALLNSSTSRQTFSDLLVSVGAATQTWDGGSGGLALSGVDLGAGNSLTLTGSGTSATNRNELLGGIQGSPLSSFAKSGAGTLYIGPAGFLDYGGPTLINSGSLVLGGGNKLADASNLVLGGGTTFDLAGFDEKTGKLTLAGNSTINFGVSNTADLVFDASQAENWGAFTLNIIGFNHGNDTLRFGTSSAALTGAQLANIKFDGTTAATIDANGFVTPVPEPSSALLMGLGAVALGGLRRRRQAQA